MDRRELHEFSSKTSVWLEVLGADCALEVGKDGQTLDRVNGRPGMPIEAFIRDRLQHRPEVRDV